MAQRQDWSAGSGLATGGQSCHDARRPSSGGWCPGLTGLSPAAPGLSETVLTLISLQDLLCSPVLTSWACPLCWPVALRVPPALTLPLCCPRTGSSRAPGLQPPLVSWLRQAAPARASVSAGLSGVLSDSTGPNAQAPGLVLCTLDSGVSGASQRPGLVCYLLLGSLSPVSGRRHRLLQPCWAHHLPPAWTGFGCSVGSGLGWGGQSTFGKGK